MNWLYQSNQVGGNGQLDARIHVYDGRLWVDRGGGGDHKDGENDDGDAESSVEPTSIQRSAEEDEDRSKSQKQKQNLPPAPTTATMSQLLVDKAQMFHSGRYVCSALGASGTWTLVHILPGKIFFLFLFFPIEIFRRVFVVFRSSPTTSSPFNFLLSAIRFIIYTT